jgi:hypothetical protein
MLDRRKLVSHRLRGFGPHENCRSALVAACASSAPHLEIDTRVSSDGVPFVYHFPRGRAPLSGRSRLAHADGATLRRVRYPSGEPLMELDECLAIFRGRAHSEQRLCIDMKDFGFEKRQFELVERHGLVAATSWMSWVPLSLVRLRDLGASGPLILAHCNIAGLGGFGGLLEGAFARSTLRVSSLVLRGVANALDAPPFAHGFQHSLLCARLPRGLERFLASCGGGICVHWSLVNDRLMRYCRDAGFRLWVVRARSVASFARYASLADVDVVICDDAPGVLRISA